MYSNFLQLFIVFWFYIQTKHMWAPSGQPSIYLTLITLNTDCTQLWNMAGGSFESWIKRAGFYLKKNQNNIILINLFIKKLKGWKPSRQSEEINLDSWLNQLMTRVLQRCMHVFSRPIGWNLRCLLILQGSLVWTTPFNASHACLPNKLRIIFYVFGLDFSFHA
jgi:hypothetical protein